MNYNELYGLRPMSLEEEANAPLPVREIRAIKVETISKLNLTKREIDYLLNCVRNIPETDDEKHSKKVAYYAETIKAACDAIINNYTNICL